MTIICKKHGEFEQAPFKHLMMHGCSKCAGRGKSSQEIIAEFREIHGNKYDYSKVDYIESEKKITIICKKHGEFKQKARDHKKGNNCPKCFGRNKTTEEIIVEFKNIHGDKYDYSKVKYERSHIKVIIICKKHGEFKQTSSHHLLSTGCPKCIGRHRTTQEFIEQANKIHKNIYDYSKVKYKKAHNKVTIICKKHGEFEQVAQTHLGGNGCLKCVGKNKNIKEIIVKFREIHGDTYDYSKTKYINAKTKMIITCQKHGDFLQTYGGHLRNGCHTCNSGWKIESIRSFLKELINIIPSMTQTEWYHILRSSGILGISPIAKGYNFANFLPQKDKLDFNELQKFVDGKPSIYEDSIETGDTTLLTKEDSIEALINEKPKELAKLKVKDIFRTLNTTSDLPYIDDEVAEALIGESMWKMIQVVCEDEKQIKEIKKKQKKIYTKEAQQRFLNLYNKAFNYKLPKNYNFRIDGKLVIPNLMQRLTIAMLGDKKSLLNLSGTGAGKTLSAILFSCHIKSNLTVIICPNDVIDVWVKTIKGASPNANIFVNNFSSQIDLKKQNYIIFNVEKFQQSNSERQIKKLLKKKIDFIILDEIQFMKNREGTPRSTRNINIHKLVSNARKDNLDFHILGMTATPIINELSEGVSLLEMVTSQLYNEISNNITISNCLAIRGHFVSMGIRWMPQYKQKLNIKIIEVDCSEAIDRVKEIKRNPLLMEQIFINKKIDAIESKIKKGSVIYTQYKGGVVETIRKRVKELGLICEPYTGDQNHSLRKEILENFRNKKIDVLVATSPISTGVDGLQHICNNLFIISLPWTSASFWQLIGRFLRQGQKKKQVNITIPLSYLNIISSDGEEKEWSWCKYRYSIVKNKKSLSDVAVDGIVPEKCHINQPKALKAAIEWLGRIEKGDIKSFKRRKISITLSESTMKRRRRKYGDFTDINKKWCKKNSSTVHSDLQKDPTEYETYHNEYKQFREKWDFDHINEIVIPYINELPENVIIGDFGSGPQAELSNSTDKEVLSFDHVETDDVISCDLADMSKEYHNSLDVAIFSLSLMGNNLTDYIREAHKCLKKDGKIFIVELSSRISSLKKIKKDFKELGFKSIKCELIDRFISISAKKSSKNPNKKIKLKLGRIK